jgi:hypothetical protein
MFREPALADVGFIKCSGRGKGMPDKKSLLNFFYQKGSSAFSPLLSKGGGKEEIINILIFFPRHVNTIFRTFTKYRTHTLLLVKNFIFFFKQDFEIKGLFS